MRCRAAAGALLAAVLASACAGPAVPTDGASGDVLEVLLPVEGAWVTSGDGDVPEGLTLEVAPDGSLFGFSGCNRFSGSGTFAAGAVLMGGLASTRMACAEPGVMDGEARFLNVLGLAQRYRTPDPDTLVLSGAGGEVLLRRAGQSRAAGSGGAV